MMGFSPAQVGAMSLWHFHACFDGWKQANCPDEGDAPSEREFFDMIAESERK